MLLDGEELSPSARTRFGYMPEERGLYPKMRLGDQLSYLARLHGYSRAHARGRAEALLERLGLDSRMKDPLEALSLGNQQRVQIAAALVHEPDVLVLDEPFSGLDPLAVDVVRGVLQEQAAQGAVVLFSSHQLDVVERLCDDLVIIGSGKVLAAGPREELRRQHGTRRFELVMDETPTWLSGMPDISVDTMEDGGALFRASDEAAQHVLSAASQRGPVRSFRPVLPTLAEIFKDVAADDAQEVHA